MPNLREFRAGKPAYYPDQAVYAAYASAEFGLGFDELGDGGALLFRVSSTTKAVYFGAGRCSWYPQNNATSTTLASDKYFASRILEKAGIATLGGDYFFLNPRHRAHRPPGHERDDAFDYLRKLNSSVFVKPLAGSRGDYALAIHGEASLERYLDDVSQHYDSVLMQPIVNGLEWRIFVLDGEIVYSARKLPPMLLGNGRARVSDLLLVHNAALTRRGLSAIDLTAIPKASLDLVLPVGASCDIPGRTNLSAGGRMTLESPHADAREMARRAAHALGLRAAAVDLFTNVGGNPDDIRIIEVNSNPSIRLLEDMDRADLILAIWRHTFSAIGLLDV